MSVNIVLLEGRLGRDPEARFTSSGRMVATFPIAVNEQWKNGEGERQENTSWFNVTAWNGLAETCVRYLCKGRRVLVQGRLRTEKYEQDGEMQYFTKVIASNVTFLDAPPEQTQEGITEETVPF